MPRKGREGGEGGGGGREGRDKRRAYLDVVVAARGEYGSGSHHPLHGRPVQSGASVFVSMELVGAEVESVFDLPLRHVCAATQDCEGAGDGGRGRYQ